LIQLQDLKISFPVKKNTASQTNPFTRKNKKPANPRRFTQAISDDFFCSSIIGYGLQITLYDDGEWAKAKNYEHHPFKEKAAQWRLLECICAVSHGSG
jgi:hypothetical protein